MQNIVNFSSKRIIADLDGARFTSLPESIKKPGKQIILSFPSCRQNIRSTTNQTIKDRPEMGGISHLIATK